MLKPIAFLVLGLLILGSPVLAQETKTNPNQEWQEVKTLDDVTKLKERVRRELEVEGLTDAVRKILLAQEQELKQIGELKVSTSGVKESKGRFVTESTDSKRELARLEAINRRPIDLRLDVTEKLREQVENDVSKKDADIEIAKSRLELVRTKQVELLKRLEMRLADKQAGPIAEKTEAETTFTKAKAEGAANVEELRQILRLKSLIFVRVSHQYEYDQELKSAEYFEAEYDSVANKLKVLEIEKKSLDDDLIQIRERLDEKAKQKTARSEDDISAKESELASLGGREQKLRRLISLEIELLKLERLKNEFVSKEATLNKEISESGTLGDLSIATQTLSGRIQDAKANPDESELPSRADELRILQAEVESRDEIARNNVKRLRTVLPKFVAQSSKLGREKERLTRLLSAIDQTPGKLVGLDQFARYEAAKVAVDERPREFKTAIDQAVSTWKGRQKQWAQLGNSADDHIRFVNDRLLWTREESNISVDAISLAGEDLSTAAGNMGDLVGAAVDRVVSFCTAKENRTRSLVALAFVLIVGIGFWFLHRRLPKTYGWLDAQASDGNNLPLVLGIILRRTEISFMLAIIFVGAPWIAGFEARTIKISACIFATPFLYRLGRVLLDVFVMPGKNEERVFDLEEKLAETLHRAGCWLLNLAAFFVPVGLLTSLIGYEESNSGFVELWWLVYESLSHAILLFSVFRPAVIGRIIRGSGIVAVSVKSLILLLYPIVVAAVLFLFVLGSLRYVTAEQIFQGLFLKTLGVMLVGYVLYRLFLRKVVQGRDLSRNPNPEEFEKDEDYVEAGQDLFFARLARAFMKVGFLVPVAFLIYRFWDRVELNFFSYGLFGEDSVSANDILKAILAITITTSLVSLIRQALAFVILPKTDLDKGLRYTVSMLVTYGLWTLGLVVTLNIVRIRGEHIAVFTGALAFGIGFGLQSIVKNFVSGLILLVERPVKVGDMIDVGNRGGSVDKITLRATTVMTWEGTGIVIPNETMVGGTLTNHSLGHPRLRSALKVGVGYGCKVRRVREILEETVKGHGLTLKRPAPEAFFMGFGDNSLDFEIRYWTSLSTHRLRVISDLRYAIEEAFRREGIEIPFPQRDLHVRTVDGEVVGSFGGKVPDTPEDEEGADTGKA